VTRFKLFILPIMPGHCDGWTQMDSEPSSEVTPWPGQAWLPWQDKLECHLLSKGTIPVTLKLNTTTYDNNSTMITKKTLIMCQCHVFMPVYQKVQLEVGHSTWSIMLVTAKLQSLWLLTSASSILDSDASDLTQPVSKVWW
jgi:hypothetical protein